MRVLYHMWLSPACRKVRLVLGEKELEFEMRVEKVWERRDDFLELNPAGEVPVLVEPGGDGAVFDIVRGLGAFANILGTKMIMGWYCVLPSVGIDNETIGAVARGIGFRGYAVPSDLATLGSDPSRTPQEQELPPPMPTIGGFSGGGSCDEPGAEYNSSCQKWFRAMETWRQRQKAK